MALRKLILLISFLQFAQHCNAQMTAINSTGKASSNYTNEFLISGGYNRCRYDFIDAGLRYYHWKNDGQTAMAFAGVAAGCEFSFDQPDHIFIPYLDWQGQMLLLGYSVRAEYAMGKEKKSFGVTPELGLSLFEMLRVTGGYRFVFDKHDPLGLSGFRFSVIAAFPLSFLKANAE